MRISDCKKFLMKNISGAMPEEKLMWGVTYPSQYVGCGVRLEFHEGQTLVFRKYRSTVNGGMVVLHDGKVRFLDSHAEKLIRAKVYKMKEFFGYGS